MFSYHQKMTKDLILNRKVKKSLEVSWKEGIPAAVMLGIMDYYLIPYALFLGATTREIGILVALPQLLAAIAQLFAVWVVKHAGSRLRFLIRGRNLMGWRRFSNDVAEAMVRCLRRAGIDWIMVFDGLNT